MLSVSFADAGPAYTTMSRTKRKHSETLYTPTFGMVTSHQIRLAIEEFNRLEREGVEHGRILVAQRVPKSKIRSSFGTVVIEADYEDINVTKKTRADLYISKVSRPEKCQVVNF